jgi:choline-sulfatase
MPFRASAALLVILCAGCTNAPQQEAPKTPAARNLLLITIDTLRADRVGAYGYGEARTPGIDALAARGARFDAAFSSAPITLTSHATIMTGRYPPGHGARHNGMRLDPGVPTMADALRQAGFATAAFVAAFPLDGRFGLNKGFDTYSDRMPRGAQGRLASERPGHVVVDEAVAWLNGHRGARFFLWVHLFEPHTPYGDPSDRRPVAARYDDEVAEADRQVVRLIVALGSESPSTMIAVAADHGEAFGEHGEISHSVFVYDTTLRVPLIIAGPGIAPSVVPGAAGLVDLAPTLLSRLGPIKFDADGIDLEPALAGRAIPSRDLYAESFAPLLDFGWSPLRSIRSGGFKYIAAPKPELYRISSDQGETQNLAETDKTQAAALDDRAQRISPATLSANRAKDPEAAARLQALGYVSGSETTASGARPDPKDKRELAARIAEVTSGELQGRALRQALERILAEDSANPQAHVRLGYVLMEARDCRGAERHFKQAIAGHLPGADAYLGLAGCQAASRRLDAAATTLQQAEAAEPDNPVVVANHGVVLSDGGHPAEAVPLLRRALTLDPEFDEARFNLALAHLRAGQKNDAAKEATELLRRLPSNAPQRHEVERLRDAAR